MQCYLFLKYHELFTEQSIYASSVAMFCSRKQYTEELHPVLEINGMIVSIKYLFLKKPTKRNYTKHSPHKSDLDGMCRNYCKNMVYFFLSILTEVEEALNSFTINWMTSNIVVSFNITYKILGLHYGIFMCYNFARN